MKLFLVVLFASVLLAECYRILPKQLDGNREKLAKLKRFIHDQKFQQSSKPQSLQSNVDIYGGDYYITNITIGTPPQQFLVIIDPTSSDLIVPDITINYDLDTTFNSAASSTYKFIGNTTDFNGRGVLIGQDVVKLGGIGTQQITIPNTRFIQDTTLEFVEFYVIGITGFLGLAFESLSKTGGAPPVLNAIHQGLLPQPIFTTYLIGKTNQTDYPPSSWNLPGGKITYGGLDPQNCGDVIAYQALSSATYFQFTLSGISIGKYSNTKSYQAYIDVENEIRGPANLIDAIANAIGANYTGTMEGEWQYYIDCNAAVPPLNLKIGSTTLSIDAKYLITNVFGRCIVNMQTMDNGGFGPSVILGQPLAQQYCTVFDLGNKRIGFAPMKNG